MAAICARACRLQFFGKIKTIAARGRKYTWELCIKMSWVFSAGNHKTSAMEMSKSSRRLVGPTGSVLASVLIVAAAAIVLAAKFHGPAAAAHDHILHGQTPTGFADTATPVAPRTTFDDEMAQVITRMHETMEVTHSGDPDRDFLRMMIPHHQGAIDMARVVLKHGHDERIRRLAQSIIVEQGQEITYMETLLAAPRAEQARPHQ